MPISGGWNRLPLAVPMKRQIGLKDMVAADAEQVFVQNGVQACLRLLGQLDAYIRRMEPPAIGSAYEASDRIEGYGGGGRGTGICTERGAGLPAAIGSTGCLYPADGTACHWQCL